jgi:hypothetical protein
MPAKILKYLEFTATQGGADAFVQASIDTNLVPADGYAFSIVQMDFSFSASSALQNISADSLTRYALTRDTKLAVSELSDPDVIYRGGYATSLTTSGQLLIPDSWSYTPQTGMIIVEPTVYFSLDSDATGLTMTLNGRIYYEEVKLTEVEILRLLNNA